MAAHTLDLGFDRSVETYLSPNVHRLLCQTAVCDPGAAAEDLSCYFADGLLNWNAFPSDFTSASLVTCEDFSTWAKRMAPLFRHIHEFFTQFQIEDFNLRLSSHAAWTGQLSSVLQCFALLREGSPAAANLSLLWLTSLLERSLGDLVLLKSAQCPSLLRDLLVTPALRDLLSAAVINFLLLLVGPPISLNLRNVAWHGFPRPGELSEQYPCVVLCTIVSIGRLLKDRRTDRIRHREMVTMSFGSTFPPLDSTALDDLRRLFIESAFVSSSVWPFWDFALQMFGKGHFGECVVVLLPQLELALRRVFIVANGCSQRLLTAENSVLFTTMDEILNPFLDDGSSVNRLRGVLGDSYLSLLLDCLVYPSGPRIRDRVSHGEVDVARMDRGIATHVISLCAALALRFLLPSNEDGLRTASVQAIEHIADKYVSMFHTISVAKQHICAATRSLSNWKTIQRPAAADCDATVPSEEIPSSCVAAAAKAGETYVRHFRPDPELNTLQSLLIELGADLVAGVVGKLENFCPNTVYRYSSGTDSLEEELLRLITRISKLIISASNQIVAVANCRYEQWQKKELRSRQRTNYGRMLHATLKILAVLRLIVVILTTTVCHIDEIISNKPLFSSLKKFLKTVQQYCENLMTYTKMDSNRWDEAATMTDDLILKVPS